MRNQAAAVQKLDPVIGYGGQPPIIMPVEGLTKEERAARDWLNRNHNHCALCMLAYQGRITKLHLQAGERLQNDAALSLISPMRGVDLNGTGGRQAGPVDPIQAKFDAMRRRDAAMFAVGLDAWAVLDIIVIRDIRPHEAGRMLGMHKRAVIPALTIALGALCSHYGIAPREDETNSSEASEAIRLVARPAS